MKLSETKDELLKCRIRAKEDDGSYVVFIDELAEKRSVPHARLRPLLSAQRDSFISRDSDQYAKNVSMKESIDKFGFGLRNVRMRTKSQHSNDLNIDYAAICNSFNFEPYINLSNFNLAANNRNEVIAYPMVYNTQPPNMNSNNNSGANNTNTSSKSAKNRNQNSQNHPGQNDTNDKQQQSQKVDNDNSYGKHVHDTKTDVQQTPTTTTGYYQHHSPEQHVDAAVSTTQHPNYYAQGTTAPIYYCATSDYSEQGMYSSEMVMHPSVYTFQAPYQTPPMQPNMYAPIPANQTSHYPVPVTGGWPTYTPPINPQGE